MKKYDECTIIEITGKYGPEKTSYSDTSRSEQLTKNEHHNKHFNVFFFFKKKKKLIIIPEDCLCEFIIGWNDGF